MSAGGIPGRPRVGDLEFFSIQKFLQMIGTSIVHNQIGCIILVEIRLNAGGLAGFVFSGKVFRIL